MDAVLRGGKALHLIEPSPLIGVPGNPCFSLFPEPLGAVHPRPRVEEGSVLLLMEAPRLKFNHVQGNCTPKYFSVASQPRKPILGLQKLAQPL